MDSQNEARARMRSSIGRKNAMICSALCAALVGYGTKAAFAVDVEVGQDSASASSSESVGEGPQTPPI